MSDEYRVAAHIRLVFRVSALGLPARAGQAVASIKLPGGSRRKSAHAACADSRNIPEDTMSDVQQGILAPIDAAARYLTFTISNEDKVAATLTALRAVVSGRDTVVGIGHSLVERFGRPIDGLTDFPAFAVKDRQLPATPADVWVWLRSDDRGELTLRSRALERLLAPAFELQDAVDAFRYANDRDLSGYEDGTENPTGDDAVAAAIVSGKGAGLDGASFVAVQQWLHDFDKMESIPSGDMDNIIGRRKSDNEELDDAPESAHVKRTSQESF
jgi:putative iron-dependent peroxidase